MNTTHPTATGTPSVTNDTTTYTQKELESRLQAERFSMAHDIAYRALDPINTLAKLLITGPETGADWATP